MSNFKTLYFIECEDTNGVVSMARMVDMDGVELLPTDREQAEHVFEQALRGAKMARAAGRMQTAAAIRLVKYQSVEVVQEHVFETAKAVQE